jgi:tetratricopeptide (TPR) repeat protein
MCRDCVEISDSRTGILAQLSYTGYCLAMETKNVIGYEFYRHYYADVVGSCVFYDERPLKVPLTALEFEVLEFFLRHPNKTLHPNSITPLGKRDPGQRHPIADYICKINNKLDLDPDTLFKNIRKVGYRLEAEDVRPRYDTDLEEASDLYATSRLHFNEHTFTTLRATVEQSRKALALNPNGSTGPNITLAYACINLCHVGYGAELPEKGMPEARRAAEGALAKNPKSAAAFGVLGLLSLIYGYHWTEAEALLKKAIDLDPKESSALLSYAHLLICRGDVEEGLKCIEQAVRVDPTDKLMYSSWGWLCLFAGDLDRADRLTKESVFRFPEFPKAHFMRGLVLEELGKYDQALTAMKRALQLEENVPHMMAGLGHLYGRMGKRKLAQSVLRHLSSQHKRGETAYLSGYWQALIYAGLQEHQMCLTALEKSYKQHCDWLIHLAVEPRWKKVRNEIRFKKLMAKVGLPQAKSVRAEHN